MQELRSFLGMVNYYSKFIPNLSTILAPLNALLHKDSSWRWSQASQSSFDACKKALMSSTVLAHYDVNLPIKVAADASAYGIGAVLSHVNPDGSERPVAFASRTLTSSERNYSQLEKEALSLIFAVKRFHQYLYGRRFTLLTDHKPLTTILGPKQGIPPLAAIRLQRWANLLASYQYTIQFKATLDHANADAMSRLPLPVVPSVDGEQDAQCFLLGQMQASPVTMEQLKVATRRDAILSKVVQYTCTSWPACVPETFASFQRKKEELSVENGCLLWGVRVVIPSSLRTQVKDQLHQDHCGISRMKAIARSYLWWPGLDQELESPPVAPMHPWIWPEAPWQRIHMDFAGPFMHKMFLVVVDARTKWPEVVIMSDTTAEKTVDALRAIFATHGLPEQVVSDNGPQFTSQAFEQFMKLNGIRHLRCSPYHSSSNCLAERFVRTFKESMQSSSKDGHSLQQRVADFLLSYRSTPHATTDDSPAFLMFKRQIRTRFDLLRPSTQTQVETKQAQQKTNRDRHSRTRHLSVGESVLVRDFLHHPKWKEGKIASQLGPLTYLVTLKDGRKWKHHIDHVKPLVTSQPCLEDNSTSLDLPPDDFSVSTVPPSPIASQQRYPQRIRKPVDRYGF